VTDTDTDFLERKRREIEKRVAELAPLAAEYDRLKAAEEALAGIAPSKNGALSSKPQPVGRRGRGRPRGSKSVASSAARVSTTTAKPRARAGRGRRKGGGKRAAQALALIRERPGITIAELAREMGTHPTYLYKVLPTHGEVVKDGRGWRAKATTSTGA
jgi:hypothetical protein